ncbi:hypothetical protein CISIN_1g0281181mg, partial [Citrus sinensis]
MDPPSPKFFQAQSVFTSAG